MWKSWVCVWKLPAYVWFLQEGRQWKKGYFIVLILMFWQENKERKALRDPMAECSLSHSLSLLSHSLEECNKLPLRISLHHAPLSFRSVVSRTSIYFHFLGIVVSKTQFLFITLQRTAALIRVTVDWSPRPSACCCLIPDKPCYSLTHDTFRPLLFINRSGKKTKKQYFNTSLHWYYCYSKNAQVRLKNQAIIKLQSGKYKLRNQEIWFFC